MGSPDVHCRESSVGVETRAREQRRADVAGEQGVTAATERRPLPLDLLESVHREAPRALEPDLVAGDRIRLQERVAVSGLALAPAEAPAPGGPRRALGPLVLEARHTCSENRAGRAPHQLPRLVPDIRAYPLPEAGIVADADQPRHQQEARLTHPEARHVLSEVRAGPVPAQGLFGEGGQVGLRTDRKSGG